MPLVASLHGRARTRRAARVRLRLLVILLLAPVGLEALEAEVVHYVYLASRHPIFADSAEIFFTVERLIACAGYLVAGILIDRFGLKRVFSLVLLAWSAVVTLGMAVADPVTYEVLSPLATLLLPGFVLTTLLVAARRAWPARRRAIVVAALVLAYRDGAYLTLFPRRSLYPVLDAPEGWQQPIFAAVSIAALLFALWIFFFPEVDRDSQLDLRPADPTGASFLAWRPLIGDPAVWSIVAIQFCVAIVWLDSPKLRWNFQPLHDGALGAVASSLAAPAVFLLAAWGSDRFYQTRRTWVLARRPVIVAGFVIAAIAPLLDALASQSGPALALIDSAALGAVLVADLLVVDLAPRVRTGRFIGLVLTAEALTSRYLRPIGESLATGQGAAALVIAIAALAGAGLTTLLLPRLQAAAH